MSTTTLTTIIKMIESLPEDKQERVVDHLRYYIAELEDEMKWDKLFKDTEKDLSTIAQEVKQKVAKGEVEDFDFNRL
ncbi:MAG: hypothetical protein GXO99_06930 [Nitrospirae bacterium]|nr:hypothetical protein [Nitrospirota bacterium]